MSQRAPQTLSVKRKRTEAPVDSLIFDNSVKRQRSEIFFRRLTKPGDSTPQESGASTPTAEQRRFHLDPVSRAKSKHVFIERRAATEPSTPYNERTTPAQQQPLPHQEPARPRKRPGTRAASSALQPATTTQSTVHRSTPSEHDVRELEALSARLSASSPQPTHPSPSKYKPHAPPQRFAQREPEKAAYLASREISTSTSPEAMDLDTDGDYVIDTYIREPLLPDSSGALPTASGSIGYLILTEAEDTDFWTTGGSDESDREFDTDGEDSNAEEYYANDYPEDELSEDDEFGREEWKGRHRRGSEEWDAGESDGGAGSGDEDDEHYRMTVPKVKRVGYWGMNGGW